jgi:hypothetical protein
VCSFGAVDGTRGDSGRKWGDRAVGPATLVTNGASGNKGRQRGRSRGAAVSVNSNSRDGPPDGSFGAEAATRGGSRSGLAASSRRRLERKTENARRD